MKNKYPRYFLGTPYKNATQEISSWFSNERVAGQWETMGAILHITTSRP